MLMKSLNFTSLLIETKAGWRMKKILFVLINMNVGGTEKAFLNMVAEIPKDEYGITILMLERYGGFLDSIPKEVCVEYFEGYQGIKNVLNLPPRKAVLELVKSGKLIEAFGISVFFLIAKITKSRNAIFSYLLRNYPNIDQEYDIAVAYAGPMDFISYFVANKIRAKQKIQWIHFDISKVGFNREFASRIYKKFDKIFVVSNEGRNKLIELIPALRDKTEVFLNVVSPKLIYEQAERGCGFTDDFNGIRILTVGRLAHEKGQDLIIPALQRLLDQGYNAKWYCLGDGRFRKKCEELIDAYDLRDRFILLGTKTNPYTFMKQCDIYVQPSRYEGYGIAIAEAKILHKPIVVTNFSTAKEQIRNGQNGIIVDVDSVAIAEGIKRLVDSPKLREALINNLLNEELNTESELQKLLKA